jgi:copper chaperone
MTILNVPSMSCGHCTATIEKAIKAIDPTASISCDIGTHNVDVDSFLTQRALSEAISGAGYEVNTTTAT